MAALELEAAIGRGLADAEAGLALDLESAAAGLDSRDASPEPADAPV